MLHEPATEAIEAQLDIVWYAHLTVGSREEDQRREPIILEVGHLRNTAGGGQSCVEAEGLRPPWR